MSVRRRNEGLLAGVERRVVAYVLPRIPDAINSDHLTSVALFGALLSAASLVALRSSHLFLIFVFAGVALNWFGDSLDGALARYRRCERHKIGFLLDKSCDLLALGSLVLALGQSSFLTPFASLLLVLAYLVNTTYGLMRVVVDGVQIIGLDGFGATEGRLTILAWVSLNMATNFSPARLEFGGILGVDAFAVCVSAIVLMRFLRNVARDIERLQAVESITSMRGVHRADGHLAPLAGGWSAARTVHEGKSVHGRSPAL